MQIQTKKAQKPTTASGQQPYRESRGLYEMAGRSLSKSPRDEPYMQLRRLFVSAVLSLICILISPVLSTDALWNVSVGQILRLGQCGHHDGGNSSCPTPTNRPGNVGAHLQCIQLIDVCRSTTTIFDGLPSTAVGFYLFRGSKSSKCFRNKLEALLAAQWSGQASRPVVLTEAKTMYAVATNPLTTGTKLLQDPHYGIQHGYLDSTRKPVGPLSQTLSWASGRRTDITQVQSTKLVHHELSLLPAQ